MKKYLIAGAALIASSVIAISAQAGEIKSKAMTDQQLDQIVAGADYTVYLNRGGNYALKLTGEPVARSGFTSVDTLTCSDDGSGSCSYGGKDFTWDPNKLQWH